MKTKIYLVSNINNDPKSVYIGKTKNSRESNHRKTYKGKISYNYIDEVDSLKRKDWEPLETKWIQHYINLGYNVVNIRKKGGSGPEFQTEKSKLKQSIAMKGKPKPNGFGKHISDIKKGIPNIKNKIKPEGFGEKLQKPKAEGFGLKISKAKKGKISSKKGKKYGTLKDANLKNINRKKIVLQIDPSTEKIINEWESRNKAMKTIGYGIARSIRIGNIYKNYFWKYKI